jgi:hypothetical protein
MKKKTRILSTILAIAICSLLLFAVYESISLSQSVGDMNDQTGDSESSNSTTTSTTDQTESNGASDTNSSTGDSDASSTDLPTGDSNTSSTDSSTEDSYDQTGSGEDHEDSADYVWDSSEVIDIELNGNSITVNATGVATVDGSTVTITSAGTYRISGSLTDGQIIVDTDDKETMRLILNGIDVSCSTSSPIYIIDAKKVIIVLEENTENYVKDGASYVFKDTTEDEPNAAIFSKSDLTIFGDGLLNVDGNYNDGIASKDGLIIRSGTITVNSVDDGIRGKDYLIIKSGEITVNAGGDGMKSDNANDATAGYISIENGVITITSGGDAIQAITDITITRGKITVTSGGGSNTPTYSDISAKGIKANVSVTIDGGIITANSADDAIHSNNKITINGGSFTISTGDDGFHADSSLIINGGDITISKSYEGLESATIIINNGRIHIESSDDAINVVGGNDASGFDRGPGMPPGQDLFTYSSDYYLHIYGGYIYVDAMGDGIDVNGVVEMTAGTLIINGPVANDNGALDFGSFKITGGFLLAVGSSGMAQAPSSTSAQSSVLLNLRSSIQAGTLVTIQSSDGTILFSFVPTKTFSSIAFSSPTLESGSTYNVYSGGNMTGTATDGLYTDGTYTPGTLRGGFTA